MGAPTIIEVTEVAAMPVKSALRCKTCNSKHRYKIEKWCKEEGLTPRAASKRLREKYGEPIGHVAIWRHMEEHADKYIAKKRDYSSLNPQQRRFVEEYIIDLNAQEAAIRAGYAVNSASVQGCRLLTKDKIKAAIEDAMHERSRRTGVTADKLVEQLAKIAFSDLKSFVEWDKDGVIIKDPAQIDGTVLAEIAEQWTETPQGFKNGRTKIKLNDKLKAIELLGKHLGMFRENVNVNGSMAVTIVDDIE